MGCIGVYQKLEGNDVGLRVYFLVMVDDAILDKTLSRPGFELTPIHNGHCWHQLDVTDEWERGVNPLFFFGHFKEIVGEGYATCKIRSG